MTTNFIWNIRILLSSIVILLFVVGKCNIFLKKKKRRLKINHKGTILLSELTKNKS
jgi:hypothetical protein